MMGTELAVAYTAQDGTRLSLDVDTVREYVTGASGLTDSEMAYFMSVCQARRANPLTREIYAVKYSGGPASIVVGKDYYIRTASMQPTFAGFEAGVTVATSTGEIERREGSLVGKKTEQLVGGWARVYDTRREHPCYAEVGLSEYSTGKSLWATKPATMIRKVALVQALRECYPDAFCGMYDSAEMQRPQCGEEIEIEEEADA